MIIGVNSNKMTTSKFFTTFVNQNHMYECCTTLWVYAWNFLVVPHLSTIEDDDVNPIKLPYQILVWQQKIFWFGRDCFWILLNFFLDIRSTADRSSEATVCGLGVPSAALTRSWKNTKQGMIELHIIIDFKLSYFSKFCLLYAHYTWI